MGLVEYDSDSEDAPVLKSQHVSAEDPAVKRKRTLPTLPPSFATGVGPNDDPSMHQGRKRTRPYVEGDYDTHVYISLPVPSIFRATLDDIVKETARRSPGVDLHSFLQSSAHLHISLAHPFPLRQSQIPEFKADLLRALRSLRGARTKGVFPLSLGGRLRVYYNGKKYGGEGHGGRAFLALRVSAGMKEIDEIVNKAIHPLLQKLHRPLYHSDPEYHASFAWCLTDPLGRGDAGEGDVELCGPELAGTPVNVPISDETVTKVSDQFQRLILDAQPKGGWFVNKIVLKIGKDKTELAL